MELLRPICSEKMKWIESSSSSTNKKDLKSISSFINEDDTKIEIGILQRES